MHATQQMTQSIGVRRRNLVLAMNWDRALSARTRVTQGIDCRGKVSDEAIRCQISGCVTWTAWPSGTWFAGCGTTKSVVIPNPLLRVRNPSFLGFEPKRDSSPAEAGS